MDIDQIEEIQEKFPFLSCIACGKDEIQYVCIIQNTDDKVISFYDLQSISDENEKRLFLELGEIWWWESNRKLPINIFLRHEMEQFKYCLRTLNIKDTEVLFGPITSLNNLFKKRIKRRQIQLVKKEQ